VNRASRWRAGDSGILTARKLRDELAARRARRESVAPKPKLRFGEAADSWLDGPVVDLREMTQAKYRTIVNQHLPTRSRWSVELSARSTTFAARRLGWKGTIPTTLMLQSERPKVSLAKRPPIFTGEQLEQTITAAHEPFRTLFTVAALTGARISELCGLTWVELRIPGRPNGTRALRVPGRRVRPSGWRRAAC
jgi:integrase